MKEQDLTKLRKQYPSSHYNVKKSQGSLIVSHKKVAVRMFKKQTEIFKDCENTSKVLEGLFEKSKLTQEDFAQKQVTITTELNNKLLKKVKEFKTRRIIFLQKLLEEGQK